MPRDDTKKHAILWPSIVRTPTTALCVAALALLLAACGRAPAQTTSQTRELMGTLVSITVVDQPGLSSEAAIEAAFVEFGRIEDLMSTYDPDSELSQLNREGSIEANPDLLIVTRRALELAEPTGGAFDITVKPLIELYEASYGERGVAPSPAELQAALELVDAGRVRIDGSHISLPPGVRLTLDGIAKGYGIDRAIESLRASGVTNALVDAGGDVRALGSKAGEPWQVALQNPRDAADYLAVIPLESHSVATSGDYRRYFDPQMQAHHILDPRSGQSAHGLISVTITAPLAMDADALATAVFVLGPERGLILVESLSDVEALLVSEQREILTSTNW